MRTINATGTFQRIWRVIAWFTEEGFAIPPTNGGYFYRLGETDGLAPVSHKIQSLKMARRGNGKVRGHSDLFFSSTALAVSTICLGVKPNFRITSGPGAETPKRFTPMIAPAGPT